MDFNLRVLISHLLIASKSWLKVIQDSLSSELSSGQPFAWGKLTPPVHCRRALAIPLFFPPCLSKILSFLKTVRNLTGRFLRGLHTLFDSLSHWKGHQSSNQAEHPVGHLLKQSCWGIRTPQLHSDPRGRGRQRRRKTSVSVEKWVKLSHLALPTNSSRPALMPSSYRDEVPLYSSATAFWDIPNSKGRAHSLSTEKWPSKIIILPLLMGSALTHSTSNGEAGILTSICLVSSFRDVGSPPNFSAHSLGRERGSRNESFSLSTTRRVSRSCWICASYLQLDRLSPTHLSRSSGSCPSPGVTTQIMLAHRNTKKCRIQMREWSPFREIIGFSNTIASPLTMSRDSSK